MKNLGSISAAFSTLKSDYRIKENIVSMDYNFTADSICPVHYKNKITGKEDIGLIAHELQEIYPSINLFLMY